MMLLTSGLFIRAPEGDTVFQRVPEFNHQDGEHKSNTKEVKSVGNFDLVRYHVQSAMRAALAESNGLKEEATRLRAQGNLRLMVMSDAEIRELAQMLSHPPARTVDSVYRELIDSIEERKKTASEWTELLTAKPGEFLPRN